MKKIMTAILLFDLAAGLLSFVFYGLNSAVAADSGMVRTIEGADGLEAEDVKKIAITFDDGPHPYYAEQLLGGLKERGVVAAFLSPEHAELHPEVIKRMQEEGHLVGNHTYSHIQLTKFLISVFCTIINYTFPTP